MTVVDLAYEGRVEVYLQPHTLRDKLQECPAPRHMKMWCHPSQCPLQQNWLPHPGHMEKVPVRVVDCLEWARLDGVASVSLELWLAMK